jgi:hypothetical protein
MNKRLTKEELFFVIIGAQIGVALICYLLAAPLGPVPAIKISSIGTSIFMTCLILIIRLSKRIKRPKRVVVGSSKGLTDLQERINFLNAKGKLKGYEAHGGIRGIYDAGNPALSTGKLHYQTYQRMPVFKRIRKWILNQS